MQTYQTKHMRNASAPTGVARLHRAALGGFTLAGPYCRRRPSLAVMVERFFRWMGA